MSEFDIPRPSPRITASLCTAARELGDEVRAVLLHSPRPVFLFYLAQTFDQLGAELAANRRAGTDTPARQLCLHLMCSHAQSRTHDHEAARLRARLLDASDADVTAEIRTVTGRSGDRRDFIALGDMLATGGMGAFFAPFESTGLVA